MATEGDGRVSYGLSMPVPEDSPPGAVVAGRGAELPTAGVGTAEREPAGTAAADPGTVGPAELVTPAAAITTPAALPGGGRGVPFQVRLDNFEGPFDLLLQLIAKHQLDLTEVALSQVTDEFITHIRALGSEWDLGQATEFLVVAATLLDLKAARLLPAAEVEDEEDLALLEARDLLFARLLQYRAYKQAAALLGQLVRLQGRRYARAVELDPRFADLLPEVLIGVDPEQFARIANRALAPKPVPTVSVDHIHVPKVSVREHAALLRERLSRVGTATFRALTQDCRHTLEVVARFLALLELYRESAVAFDQVTPLGELHIRWSGVTGGAQPGEPGPDIDEEYG